MRTRKNYKKHNFENKNIYGSRILVPQKIYADSERILKKKMNIKRTRHRRVFYARGHHHHHHQRCKALMHLKILQAIAFSSNTFILWYLAMRNARFINTVVVPHTPYPYVFILSGHNYKCCISFRDLNRESIYLRVKKGTARAIDDIRLFLFCDLNEKCVIAIY